MILPFQSKPDVIVFQFLKYNLAIFVSLLDLILAFAGAGGLIWGIADDGNLYKCIPSAIAVVISLALWYPCRAWRVKTRREVEYDEFGI